MATVRADLLALNDAALVALSNKGLVHRARKDVEEGKLPALSLGDDGVLTATFEGGTTARLVPGKALKDCPCSCAAASVCRHRLTAILAYQREAGSAAPPAAAPGSWSPGEVDDAALEKLLGRPALERARALRRRGLLAEVVRGTFEGDSLPRVRLQTSTVSFLVQGDASYARCDCRLRTGCEHVAVAVWAFRLADERDRAAASLTVEIAERTASADERRASALHGACALAGQVLLEGVTRLPAAASARFALARTGLEQARLTWPLQALEDLEELVSAYQRRSARYSPEQAALLLAELFARARASRGGGALPPGLVLGSDVALEAELDQLRLTALGARVEEDGERRIVSVFLADPASQTVLVLPRLFEPVDGRGEDGPALSRRTAVAGASLGVVAAAQLHSNAARRKANRLLSFGVGPLKKTTVSPGGEPLEAVPESLAVRDVAAFVRQLGDEAPRFLRPRLLAEHVRVFPVAEVAQVSYDESEQAVRAACLDASGGRFEVELAHRNVAPGALQALALGLRQGGATAVVGDARKVGSGLVVQPLAVVAGRLSVLDLEAPSKQGAAALAALPHAEPRRPADLVERAVASTRQRLADAAHLGLRSLPAGWDERLRQARGELAEAGFARAAEAVAALELAAAAARATGSAEDEEVAVERWVDAALRLELLQDRL